ncbi:MAG: flagellar protein FlaG [Bryobacteraceae bacterium]|jgi:hypothetical protein
MDVNPVANPGQALPAMQGAAGANWLVANREMIRAVMSIDASALFGGGTELTFALDRETKHPVVRIVNPQTGDVLWEAPPEYLLRLARSLGHGSDAGAPQVPADPADM